MDITIFDKRARAENMSPGDKRVPPQAASASAFPDGRDKKSVGRRLRFARKYLKLRQGDFIAPAKIEQNTYSQYETGRHMLPVEIAVILCDYELYRKTLGLNLEYIYRGDTQLCLSKFTAWLGSGA